MEITQELRTKFNIPEGAIFDGSVDLINPNPEEYHLKKISYAIGLFGIDYIAGKSLKKIADLIEEPIDIFISGKLKFSDVHEAIGPDKAKKFFQGIENFRNEGIPLHKLIRAICYDIDNLGNTSSKQFAKYLSGIQYDYSGLEKKVMSELHSRINEINNTITVLELSGCSVLFETDETFNLPEGTSIIEFVMTGSPKEFGFKTKADFVKELPSNCKESSKLTKDSNYLVTDDLNSKSSKTKTATKLGIQIVTYEDFLKIVK